MSAFGALAETVPQETLGLRGGSDRAPTLSISSTLPRLPYALVDEHQRGEGPLAEPPGAVLPTPEPTSTVAPAPDPRVEAVRRLLAGRPLEPYAAAMVTAADEHGIGWRLMPVISILESQGGLTACGGNAWGYAKCNVRFGSYDEGIRIVAATLAGYRASESVALCIWVSGSGCKTEHARNYVLRASWLYGRLGGHLVVPYVPPVSEDEVLAAGSDAASPTATPPAGASPTATSAATPTGTATVSPTAATATAEPSTTPEAAPTQDEPASPPPSADEEG